MRRLTMYSICCSTSRSSSSSSRSSKSSSRSRSSSSSRSSSRSSSISRNKLPISVEEWERKNISRIISKVAA